MLHKFKIVHDRYPRLGPVVWVLTVQFFVAQVVVALAWPPVYSWRWNSISDLGNTSCGMFNGEFICSPLHTIMNLSLIALGISMAAGALLIYQEFPKSRLSLIGFCFLAASGVGALLVGIFPENSIAALHIFGASLPFFIGNIGIVILGLVLRSTPISMRIYTCLSGLVSLAALFLLAVGKYFGIGAGGMERLVSYPETIWLIVFGLYILCCRFHKWQ